MDLSDYERAKFELADIVRSLQSRLSAPARNDDRLHELFVRLAEDRFNLVVVGRFNRGKSSLMNAVLGTASLPVGIVPLTSVITTVTYGSRTAVSIRYGDRLLTSDVALEALPEYVTQRGNPGNVRDVEVAEVKLPVELLRRGFYFVDTPGLGSTIEENTRTTEQFLPQADAFVLVTTYEAPLSAEELELVRLASGSARRIFVVVNKQDLVSDAERAEALRDLEMRLAGASGLERLSVFSVSARQALSAKLAGDGAALAQSGIERFEEELTRFLLADKRTQFLLRLCDRVRQVARDMLPPEQAQMLAERLNALSLRVDPGTSARATTHIPRPAGGLAPQGLTNLAPCEICESIVQAAFDYLCHFQYRVSIDHVEQEQHAGRGGLCSLHTWQYAALASTHGICTGYPPLLQRLSTWFRHNASVSAPATALASQMARLLAGAETCPLCMLRARTEKQAVSSVAARIAQKPRGALSSLSTVCLPHLRLVIEALDDPDAVQDLMLREAVILERLSEDMRRYAVKHDAVRRTLASDEETQAARTAVAALVGLRNVNMAAVHE